MSNSSRRAGFVIDGLPRTGSTTLTQLLNCHPGICCLMEPFHPKRYGGQFNRMARDAGSVEPVLNLIWRRWNGLKHVWEPAGWPFQQNPELNAGIVLHAAKVVFLRRRNLLRRFVSGFISKQLRFWVGTREEFLARLESIQIAELDPLYVREQIGQDHAAVETRLRLLERHGVPFLSLYYEELYGEDADPDRQRQVLNRVLEFLGFDPLPEEIFANGCARLLDPAQYRWSSADVYRLVPGIEDVERQAGSDATGWLFR